MATRRMIYPGMEGARFLRATPAAVALANHRYEAKLRDNPHLMDEVAGLLMENTNTKDRH